MLKLLHGDRRVLAVLALTLAVVAFSSVSALASPPKPVKVADDYFGTTRLTINRGTKVTWNWAGFFRHNVSVKTGPTKFRSPTQVHGTWSSIFRHRGTYHMYCTLHPNMQMTIYVR